MGLLPLWLLLLLLLTVILFLSLFALKDTVGLTVYLVLFHVQTSIKSLLENKLLMLLIYMMLSCINWFSSLVFGAASYNNWMAVRPITAWRQRKIHTGALFQISIYKVRWIKTKCDDTVVAWLERYYQSFQEGKLWAFVGREERERCCACVWFE